MKKRIAVIAFVATVAVGYTSFASNASNYEVKKQELEQTSTTQVDPYGKSVKKSNVDYIGNKNKSPGQLKKAEQVKGYVDDKVLDSKGGKYLMKTLMTYKEFYDLGIDTAFYQDIDPSRMVWVIQSKFMTTQKIADRTVDAPTVTTVYDAETGESLIVVVKTDTPEQMHVPKKDKQ